MNSLRDVDPEKGKKRGMIIVIILIVIVLIGVAYLVNRTPEETPIEPTTTEQAAPQ